MLAIGQNSSVSMLSPLRFGAVEIIPPTTALTAEEAKQNPLQARAQPFVTPILARDESNLFAQDYMQNVLPSGLTLEPFRSAAEAYSNREAFGAENRQVDVWA
jgi:hypothetical protein